MRYRRQVNVSFFNPAVVLIALFSISVFSCVVPKKYPHYKPFVFNNIIKVEGDMKTSEKRDLAQRLANQLDDSLRTQIVSLGGIYKKLVNPPVFDSMNVRRSLGFMIALLNSLGYYSPSIKDTFRIDTVHRDQYRVTTDFQVRPGKNLKFDSIGYALQTPQLQALALKYRDQSLLKKGHPYSKQVISSELDRLVELFKNNGYYKFSKDDMVVERDTVVAGLIDPTLDPFQQFALLEELKKKREHPTVNVVVKERLIKDSTHITKYYIGKVTLRPDRSLLEDTSTSLPSHIDTTVVKNITIISQTDKFKPAFLASNVFLRPGNLYKQDNYDRTLSRFNQMGAWQQAAIIMVPSDSSDSVLDAGLALFPGKKQKLNVDLETSRNTNDIVTASNLLGVGLSFGLTNRNTFQESVQSTSSIRGGVEFGSNFIQTTQASFSHDIFFPKVIPTPAPWLNKMLKLDRVSDNLRTVLNFNTAYTDRREFFKLLTFNSSWGYEWAKVNKQRSSTRSFIYKPLNIEYTSLTKTDSLQKFLDSIPSLNLAFKSGLVIGQQFIYNSVRQIGIHTNFFHFSAEESGAALGFIKSLDEGPLWRYVKGDIEFRHHIDYKKTELAFRAYAGAGWAYGREGSGYEQTLPFYKAFFAGGPQSMRGWQVRQLGLGSSKFYDTAGAGILDRFGDVQLEGNIEYLFPLGTVIGIKIKSAVYTDIGNIWNRHADSTNVGSDFKFNRFYKEFAVDAGTGLRLDFDYFLIRFDWAYKIRDPQRYDYPNRWFYDMTLGGGQFQLGINYPF